MRRNYRPALDSEQRLAKVLYLRDGLGTDVITTIGEAARFLVALPASFNGRIEWTMAGSTLEAADRHQGSYLVETATNWMELALAAEGMLQNARATPL